jgi:16S rRNA (guanine966-N2)-methyltransferase
MRIIAGAWRGRAIAAPAGDATRPTSDRAREAVFSMLTSRLGSFEGLAVLDGFAGSGALGLEALSRGAAHVTFVEQAAAAAAAIRANLKALGAPTAGGRATLLVQAMASLGPAPAAVDLVFLDPPYGQGLIPPAIARLAEQGWLTAGTLVAAETAASEAPVTPLATPLDMLAERRFGKARITLLRA